MSCRTRSPVLSRGRLRRAASAVYFGGAQPDDSPGRERCRRICLMSPELAAGPRRVSGRDSSDGPRRRRHSGARSTSLGLADSTCVIFATDHGAAMPRAKCTLYDPGIEVALLWRWPSAGLGGGRIVADLISNVDVTPTLLRRTRHASARPTCRVGAFWPLLQGMPFTPRAEVFAEKTFHTYYEPMRAIRTARHKLIVNLEISTSVDVPTDVRESPIYPLMLPRIDECAAAPGGVRPGRRPLGTAQPGRRARIAPFRATCSSVCWPGCARPTTRC